MTPCLRRLPIGAEVQPEGTHFRVWAPASKRVSVVVGEKFLAEAAARFPLDPEGNGYFSGTIQNVGPGTLYQYELDSGRFPDPASRFQPEGVHGPSQVVEANSFPWTDGAWKGVSTVGQVIYEMHVGTFTPEGTWRAAIPLLPQLKELGLTILEIMPVAEFSGKFGWGYDGVDLFAPTRLYGKPDDFRAFVDAAHAEGLAVILDVVYNHFGPDGCYLRQFSPNYFTKKYDNEWGEAINFDGEDNAPVREFFAANASYWIDEFHLDGLRLDATQQVYDDSPEHILSVISRRVRTAAPARGTYLVNENEPQDVKLVTPSDQGGYGMDSLWNDDFHHSAIVALTGRNEAYYTDYQGKPQEFISMAKYGYLYQGQRYKWQKNRRGTPSLHLPATAFVSFIQNHDQVANSLHGQRIHKMAAPGALRALTALTLLGPQTPMLFQGQEFAASCPFLYFADHNPELAAMVAKGRQTFLRQFPSVDCIDELDGIVAEPAAEATFLRCKLDHSEREKHREAYLLHKDLLRLRREQTAFTRAERGKIDGAVLGERGLVLRYFGEAEDDLLLVVNLGEDLHLDPAPEPLLAPMRGKEWQTLWTSEHPRYGGSGTPKLDSEANWVIPGHAAVVLTAKEVNHDVKVEK